MTSRTPKEEAAADRYPGMPRWVKIAGLVVLVIAVLLVVVLLLGGHGPSDHLAP